MSQDWLTLLLLILYSSSHLPICEWSSSSFATVSPTISSRWSAASSRFRSPSTGFASIHSWASSTTFFNPVAITQYACSVLPWSIVITYSAIPLNSAPCKAPYLWAAGSYQLPQSRWSVQHHRWSYWLSGIIWRCAYWECLYRLSMRIVRRVTDLWVGRSG